MKNNNKKSIINDIYSIIESKKTYEFLYEACSFSSHDEFSQFCLDNNLNLSGLTNSQIIEKINKKRVEKKSEYFLRLHNKGKNEIIKSFFNDELSKFPIGNRNDFIQFEKLKKELYKNQEIKNVFLEILDKLKKCKKIFTHYNISKFQLSDFFLFNAIYKISTENNKFKQSIDTFVINNSERNNPTKIIISLYNHLFQPYKIPICFYSLLFDSNFDIFKYFVEYSQGGSTKELLLKLHQNDSVLPILTKKEIAYLSESKEFSNTNLNNALIYLELRRYSKNPKILTPFSDKVFLSRNPKSLITEYISFIDKIEMFSIDLLMPLFDYLKNLRNEYIRDGKIFLLKGRSIDNLILEMEDWHKKLNKSKSDGSVWNGKFEELFFGKISENEFQSDVYIFTELTTSKQLLAEGKDLSHCVYSYRNNCINGKCHIISVKRKLNGITKRVLTIEVSNFDKVVQIRGKGNRKATNSEMFFVEKWKNKLMLT